jgi:hypothetical protein
MDTFRKAGGENKLAYGQLTICWGPDEAAAKREAFEWWPNTSIPGELGLELPEPQHFEEAAQLLSPDDVAAKVQTGPDGDAILGRIGEFVDAGFDHVFIHQVGPRQEAFLEFAGKELLPAAEEQWGRAA